MSASDSALSRVSARNAAPIRADGTFVLYWMIAARRTRWNHGLERALALARELDRPLLVLEALSASYRWASDRFHAFAIEGMRDNRAAFARAGIAYHAYVEPERGDGRELMSTLAGSAAAVVTDEWPCFHLPAWVERVAARSPARVEAVDSCGLLPLRAAGRELTRALDMRRHVQRSVLAALEDAPLADPLEDHGTRPIEGALPREWRERWPAADLEKVDLAGLPIDHGVPPVPSRRGGERTARARLARFLDERIARYEERNEPDAAATSELSPYLHFGHLSTYEVLHELASREDWDPSALEAAPASGKREGFWGMSAPAEAFLDQLVTWRELCFNTAFHRPQEFDSYDGLPAYARATLAAHERDARPRIYGRDELDRAETDDPLWNAAQRQLRREGSIHNYLRMLWGKRVLTWTRSGRDAFETLVALNDRWSLDGRDPNSYGGIGWCLGRYDRGWPEREIFGVVRCMTSRSALSKLDLAGYLRRYGPDEGSELR